MGRFKDKIASILYPPGTTRLDPKVSFALVLILFSTQLTLTTPFAYLPSMVKRFGYSDKDTGYYAGIIASSLFVGRFIGGYFWGYVTDKYGRRPVLLVSASLTYFSTLFFGFSTNLYFAVTARFLQGLFNGVIVCGRAAFAEICDDTNQAIGVSLIFAAWNAAIVLGPALGGFLAHPTRKFPSVFGKGAIGKFFRKFEYLLPSIVISFCLLMSIIAVFFTFEETLSTKQKSKAAEVASEEEESDEEEAKDSSKLLKNHDNEIPYESKSKEQESHGKLDNFREEELRNNRTCLCCDVVARGIKSTALYSLVCNKLVAITVGLFGMSGFVIIGFQELTALWMATGVKYGGLGFTTDKIGMALLWPALCSVILQPIIFGRIERRIGGIRTLQIFLVFLAIMTAGFPFLNKARTNTNLLWPLVIIMRFIRMLSDISVRSALAMFVNNSVYPEQAGIINGYAFSVQEIMRVFSPSLLGALFAWSIRYGIGIGFPLTHHCAFMVLAIIICGELLVSFALPQTINLPMKRQSTEKK